MKKRTIKRSELSTISMVAGKEKRIKCVLMPPQVLHRHRWVGIGWVDEGPATEADLKKYPTVIED